MAISIFTRAFWTELGYELFTSREQKTRDYMNGRVKNQEIVTPPSTVKSPEQKREETVIKGDNEPSILSAVDLKEPEQNEQQKQFSEWFEKICDRVISAFEPKQSALLAAELGKGYGQGLFPKFFKRDKDNFKKVLGIIQPLQFMLITLQLDPKDPKSHDIFRELFIKENVDIPWDIKRDNMTVPDPNLVPRSREFFASKLKSLNTNDELIHLIKETRINSYFASAGDLEDESLNDYPTDWLKMAGVRGAEIANGDIEKYLMMPKGDAKAATIFFKNIVAAWKIITRPTISLTEKNNLKRKLRPVLTANMKFIHSHSLTNPTLAEHMVKIHEISRDLEAIPPSKNAKTSDKKIRVKKEKPSGSASRDGQDKTDIHAGNEEITNPTGDTNKSQENSELKEEGNVSLVPGAVKSEEVSPEIKEGVADVVQHLLEYKKNASEDTSEIGKSADDAAIEGQAERIKNLALKVGKVDPEKKKEIAKQAQSNFYAGNGQSK